MWVEREIEMRDRIIRLLAAEMDWWIIKKHTPATAHDSQSFEICTTEGVYVISVRNKPPDGNRGATDTAPRTEGGHDGTHG